MGGVQLTAQAYALHPASRVRIFAIRIYEQKLRAFVLNVDLFSLHVAIFRLGAAGRAELRRFNHQQRSTSTSA
jgi:hypothetical protein